MLKGILNNQSGSYQKTFIIISIISFCYFIHSLVIKDISSILISLSVFLNALKQVVIPIDLNQKISPSKVYSISDDDFIRNYNSMGQPDPFDSYNKDNVWHRLIIWGDKISNALFVAWILYILFI